jgi:predicted transcriptional regulator
MKNKDFLTKMQYSFIKAPTKLLNLGLSSNALHLVLLMLSLPEEFNPSMKYLTSKMKLSRPTVMKAIKELVDARVIERSVGKKGCCAKYGFLKPEYRRIK